jgi:hypothetical protein
MSRLGTRKKITPPISTVSINQAGFELIDEESPPAFFQQLEHEQFHAL